MWMRRLLVSSLYSCDTLLQAQLPEKSARIVTSFTPTQRSSVHSAYIRLVHSLHWTYMEINSENPYLLATFLYLLYIRKSLDSQIDKSFTIPSLPTRVSLRTPYKRLPSLLLCYILLHSENAVPWYDTSWGSSGPRYWVFHIVTGWTPIDKPSTLDKQGPQILQPCVLLLRSENELVVDMWCRPGHETWLFETLSRSLETRRLGTCE